VGNRKKAAVAAKGKPAEAADFSQDLAVEVDGQVDGRNETDVSAFVEALRKRGFLLKGERFEAVDMSNKMFVRMNFIKAASPSTGDEEKKESGGAGGGMRKGKKGEWPPVVEKVDESKILKPCVYKLR
jgi:ribosomal RNA-processing protein 8